MQNADVPWFVLSLKVCTQCCSQGLLQASHIVAAFSTNLVYILLIIIQYIEHCIFTIRNLLFYYRKYYFRLYWSVVESESGASWSPARMKACLL